MLPAESEVIHGPVHQAWRRYHEDRPPRVRVTEPLDCRPDRALGAYRPRHREIGNFDHARITAALAGNIETTDLTDEEKDVWLDSFVEKMGQPGADEDAFFTRRQQLGLGVGLDEGGNLVREKAAHKA